jgi:integrase
MAGLMPRVATGSVLTRTLGDGTRSFRLRFHALGKRQDVFLHERPGCTCGCGGGWDERNARTELGNIQARVRAEVWRPPQPPAPERVPTEAPTFHEYASTWLQGKLDGTIGEKPLAANTEAGYRWLLKCHLLPFFADHRLEEIDARLCLAFKAQKVGEASELRNAISAGAEIRDRRGRRQVALSASSIRKAIGLLAAILDEALADELITQNPARGKRLRLRVPKPRRTFLEIDELVALLDAAKTQDALPAISREAMRGESTRARVARRLAAGQRHSVIAAELSLTKATIAFHASRLGVAGGNGGYVGRRATIELLARTGLRASELCDLRLRDVRLHDPDGARFQIRDSKTEAGIREVQMTPALLEAFVDHLDRLRRADQPTGPDDYAVPNLRSGRMGRQRVAQIVGEAATLARSRSIERGQQPLPHVTPHSLRRTYISISLLANNFDVKWVMSQVGHADSKMTLDVYAQLEQRAPRDHGRSFDRLVSADGKGEGVIDTSGPESADVDHHGSTVP